LSGHVESALHVGRQEFRIVSSPDLSEFSWAAGDLV
jgi:hypothetical protein